MKLSYENARCALYVSIMMLACSIFIYKLKSCEIEAENKRMAEAVETSNLLKLEEMKDSIIDNNDVLYLYMNDYIHDFIIKSGRLVAQDDSSIKKILINDNSVLTVYLNAQATEIFIQPGGTLRIELKTRTKFLTLKNTFGVPIFVDNIPDSARDTDDDYLQLPITLLFEPPK